MKIVILLSTMLGFALSRRVVNHDLSASDLSFLSASNFHDGQKTQQTNLAAPNWVYGNLTEEQLKLRTLQEITSSRNVVKCQLSKPFFDGSECLQCAPGTYFNLDKKVCESCPSGFANHRCK